MSVSGTSIDPDEAAHFGRLAADWWDPKGSSAMLHRLNPARLRYVRLRLDEAWGIDPRQRRPLAGRRALDVGCGAGLLSEPLARLGAAVTAVDAAPENVAVARVHAEQQGLSIDYRAGSVEQLREEQFDLVVCMEVVEHVADPASFVAALARLIASDGILIISTPNRTLLSRLAMITLGEGLGFVPRGTHDHAKFLTPDEMASMLDRSGFAIIDRTGLSFDPRRGFHLSSSLELDYFLTGRRKSQATASLD